jgi:hypothetical protein
MDDCTFAPEVEVRPLRLYDKAERSMTDTHRGRRGGVARHARLGLCALVVSLAALVGAAPALAVEHHPKGAYERFKDCPLSNPATELCLFAQTESGEFVVGKKTVPISKTLTLQGGLHEVSEEHLEFIAAEDGNTLSKTPQPVPGGLLGIVAPSFLPGFLQTLFNEFINKGITGVTAATELAAPASTISFNLNHLIEGSGTAFTLPVKVKLDNPFLGSNCYIGSNAHPINLELTTGKTSPPPPNTSITGKVGEINFEEEFTIVKIAKNSLVNNSFAAPGAEGCGGIFSFLIDPAVNSQLGIPSAAGHNTAILSGTLFQGVAEAVKAHE